MLSPLLKPWWRSDRWQWTAWAVLFPLTAWGLQAMLWEQVKPLVWIFFYPAVFFSSLLGGWRSGVAATALSAMMVGLFFVATEAASSPQFAIQSAVFLSMGGLFSAFTGRLKAGRALLEERVAARTRELEQTAQSLRQRKAELRLVTDTAHVGLVMVDRHHRYRFANRTYTQILGLPDIDLVGRAVAEMVPAAYESQIRPRLDRALAGEYVEYQLHLPGLNPSSPSRHFSVSYAPVIEGTERAVVVAIADMTASTKNAEVAARLAAIVESSSDAIIGKDLDGVVVSWNAGAEAVFGYPAREMIGRSIKQLIPPDRQAEEDGILRRIRGGEGVRHFETVRTHRDGRVLDISLTVSPIRDAAGKIIGASKVARDITAAREVQRILADSEERLRLAVEVAQLGTWERDFRTGRLTWSARQEQMMGFAPGTFPGTFEAFRALVHPEDGGVFDEAQQRATANGGLYQAELRFVLPEGSIRWGFVRGRMFFDADGKPERMVGIELDVTERRLAEDALRSSEARYRSLVQQLPAGVFRKDRAGRFEFVSERFCQIEGLPPERFLGRTASEVADLLAASDEELMHDWRTTMRQTYHGSDHHREIMETGKTIEVEEEWLSGKGERRFFQAVKTPVFGAEGTVVGSQGVLFEITDRKRAELALRETEIRFTTAFHSSPVAIAINRRRDLINLEVNETFLRLFECAREEIVGHTLLGAGLLTREVVQGLRAELDVVGRVDAREVEATTKTGRALHLALSVRVIELGGEACALSTVVDITRGKCAELDLQRLNTELEQRVIERTAELRASNQELEAFTYTVSHDLRAPLRAVDGFSQAVLEDFSPLLPPDGQRQLQVIRQSAQRMGELIDDLLAFSRLSRSAMVKQTLDTGTLVQAALAELKNQTEGRSLELKIGALPACQGDPSLLKQVWINLLSNALKYSRNRAQAQIEIGAQERDGHVTYFVRDNGAGFDMRYVGKLFGVFRRLHRAEDYEGTGVGLAIVQRIVQRHGGRVWAEGEVDRGATFSFTLSDKLHL